MQSCSYLHVDGGWYVREWSWGAAAAVHAAAGAAAAAGTAAGGAAADCWGLPVGVWLHRPMTGVQDGKPPASGPSADRLHAVGLPDWGHALVSGMGSGGDADGMTLHHRTYG